MKAALIGRIKIATPTLTSSGIGTRLKERRPRRPTGNQQRKSETAIVMRRRAMVASLLLEPEEDLILLTCTE